jgi:hypothetical protein
MDENEKRTEFTDDRPITEEPSEELGNLAAQINEQDKREREKLANADVLSSVILFALAVYTVISGLRMILFEETGTKVWYYSPGLYPVFVGSVLGILSVMMFIKKYRAGGRINIKRVLGGKFRISFKSPVIRLCIAIGLLVVYVFVLIGRLPFIASTFIYLSATMVVFRQNKMAIWKLLLISACVATAIYAFFHYVAAIPLP